MLYKFDVELQSLLTTVIEITERLFVWKFQKILKWTVFLSLNGLELGQHLDDDDTEKTIENSQE